MSVTNRRLFDVIIRVGLTIEEADVRLGPYAIHGTQTGAKRLVILSGDTKVMVLAH